MPNMMKNVQQIRTMFPIGFKEESNVCTTSFNPGALLITRKGLNARTNLNTRSISNIFDAVPNMAVMLVSMTDIKTKETSIIFQPDLKYACSP